MCDCTCSVELCLIVSYTGTHTVVYLFLFLFFFVFFLVIFFVFFFQAEDGIRDLVRSRGLGDVYKRQTLCSFRRTLASASELLERSAPTKRDGFE